jgi:purine-cytosine permease-like protein
MVVSAFAIGALAYPVFYLGFVDTILTIFFINILGILPVCFFSTFGPRFGLRQMVLSRFFFGWYGVKVSKFTPRLPVSEISRKTCDLHEPINYNQYIN